VSSYLDEVWDDPESGPTQADLERSARWVATNAGATGEELAEAHRLLALDDFRSYCYGRKLGHSHARLIADFRLVGVIS
jgi:hypothetical protein